MPEFHPTIGDAIGAAMAHNIRLAHSNEPATAAPPNRPDPYSVPGMLLRLTETTAPADVARMVHVLRTREGEDDIFAAPGQPPAESTAVRPHAESNQQRAAGAASPRGAAQGVTPYAAVRTEAQPLLASPIRPPRTR